jgi:DNA-binding NtrC family response regulator
MLSLGRFLDCLNRLPNEKTFHSRLLDCIRRQFPFSGARLHLPSSAGLPGPKVAALDSVREDYLSWLETAPIEPPIHVESDGRVVSISVALSRGSTTRGWLYLERPGGLLPELDFDLLVVLKGIIEQLLERPVKSRADASARSLAQETTAPFVGKHPSVVDLLGKVDRFARTGSTILLSGESGTGKELLARMIHEASGLKGAFVAVNCATFSRDLIESQLFGHARGAFTGATGDQTGFFEAAAGGTLFLDEISAMPFDLQPRLLRVLEEHKVIRLGETFERDVDARIVAATNRDLVELCAQKKFRFDLYHRLNVLRLEIPPLRERSSDIPLLCRHFLARLERELGLTSHLTPDALALLQQYSFPGNVRELANLLEKLACSSRDGSIDRTALETELDRQHIRDSAEMSPYLQQILADLDSGRTNFWTGVREPFLERRLSRSDVRLIVSIGLEKCEGSYRRLTRYFGLRDEDYKRFLGFLSNHGCKVDFRPYRNR